MKTNISLLRGLIIFIFFSVVYQLAAQNPGKSFDELIGSHYKSDEPGAAVLIARDGEVIYRKAFGMASLELSVPMKPEMVFEIGSMTKQFTAVAILMLEEQGKLSLDDEITRYLPDYPTHGYKITLHHLLTHTSGIKSYTSMPEWMPLWRKDMSPTELIDVFKDQPMDFAPGDNLLYNNSAYFILGYVIEKASGIPYEQFVEEKIFKPLEMNHSFYGSHTRLIPNRAAGYQKSNDGFANAEYLSLTHPYAAGSLMSNVDDLLKWQLALETNKLIRPETLQKAFTNYTLTNGKTINYGYGWALNEINGSPTREHGGGIFGYTTNGIWLPDEKVYVVMLTNRDDIGPDDVSIRLAAEAIGKPYDETAPEFPVSQETLESYSGVYEFEDGVVRSIFFEDGRMFSQRSGSTRIRIIPVSQSRFRYDGSFSTIEFIAKENGEMQAIFSNRADKTPGQKTDRVLQTRQAIDLDPSKMQDFTGIYDVMPGFSLTVTLEEGHLMALATGQNKFEIFPESPAKFFLTVVDAQIEFFRDEEGLVSYLILYQAGQEIKGMKRK